MNERVSRVSLDTIVFTLLVAAYVPLRFIIPLPQWIPGQPALTALLLLSVALYWLLDLIAAERAAIPAWIARGKWLIVMLGIALIAIGPTLMIVFVRHQAVPYLWAHDGLIQNEIAVEYVLAGRNPYAESYVDTPMALAPFKVGNLTDNPALHYYAYLPMTFLLPLGPQLLAKTLFGWFDHRFLLLACFVGVLSLAGVLARRPDQRLLLVMALGLNPLTVTYLIEGRNDVMTLFWIVLSVALLQRKHNRWAAVALAVACGTKHTAWFLWPFWALYVGGAGQLRERLRRAAGPIGCWAAVLVIILLPWLTWDAGAFVDDTVGTLIGTTPYPAPIEGLGFGGALLSVGLLASPDTEFPFWIIQLITFGPLLIWRLVRQWRANHLASAVSSYALVLFVFTFFSRLFNDNYFGYAISLLIVAALLDGVGEPR